jgi:hypothetical protein
MRPSPRDGAATFILAMRLHPEALGTKGKVRLQIKGEAERRQAHRLSVRATLADVTA